MAFQYKSLDGWIVPGVAYFRKLQAHALEMEDELKKLREKLAVSGSRALQDRAEEWAKQWQMKCIENGELKRQLIEQAAEKDAEISRLQYRVEYLEQQVEQYEKAENPGKRSVQRGRDPKTGRFDTSVPASDKPFRAWLMKQQGYNTAQIAVKLNVSADTVKRYIRDQEASRRKEADDAAREGRPGVYLA